MIHNIPYQNPILTGFHADPSICRAGSDYYLAVSSFLYFPGIPIYHSRDLLHWEQIGNAVSWENPIDLHGMDETGGIWAPTLRYHNGLFFLTAAVSGYGNFIIHAENPAGPWSAPVWVEIGGVDPDLFWEGEACIYSTNERCGGAQEAISAGVVNPFTGKIEKAFRPIWHGSGGPHLEAPHLYHVGDWYYLMAAEGGTAANHMITIARSRTLFGEYEACSHNPILTNRDDARHEIYGAGHGDLVEAVNGSWWLVCLGTRAARRTMSQLGRETFLMPVRWEKEWPVCGSRENDSPIRDVSVHLQEYGPLIPEEKGGETATRGLSDSFWEAQWPPFWHFLGNPDLSQYERGGGRLLLKADKQKAMLVTPQPDFTCQIYAEIEHKGADCGIILYHEKDFYYRFGLTQDAKGAYRLCIQVHADELLCEIAAIPWQDNHVSLRIEATKERYYFYYEKDGSLGSFTTRFLANEVVGRSFTGTMAGVYAEHKGAAGDKCAAIKKFEITY